MPLLDHFHPPLSEPRHDGYRHPGQASHPRRWLPGEAFDARWSSAIADALNEGSLPEHLFAEPSVHTGGQVDVATLDECVSATANGSHAISTAIQTTPAPTWVIPALFSDSFEVHVFNSDGGPKLVAAIKLVSPSNKDRPQTRRAFAIKCASYLNQGIHVIIVDVVTNRSANLHNEMMTLLETSSFRMPADASLYATAYRPVLRDARQEIDVWPASLAIGARLPTLPLFVSADESVLVDFEATYQETCERLRLPA